MPSLHVESSPQETIQDHIKLIKDAPLQYCTGSFHFRRRLVRCRRRRRRKFYCSCILRGKMRAMSCRGFSSSCCRPRMSRLDTNCQCHFIRSFPRGYLGSDYRAPHHGGCGRGRWSRRRCSGAFLDCLRLNILPVDRRTFHDDST